MVDGTSTTGTGKGVQILQEGGRWSLETGWSDKAIQDLSGLVLSSIGGKSVVGLVESGKQGILSSWFMV
jgi:hypothetical protein